MRVDYLAVKEFYNRQAINRPDSAAILAVENEIAREYRIAMEWNNFTRLVELRKNMDVLELGCGAGRWCFKIAPLVNSMLGVDFSEEVINIALRKNNFKNCNFLKSDIRDFNINKKFDLIYFSGVLLYINDEDVIEVIKRFSKLLKENGKIIIRDSCAKSRKIFIEFAHGKNFGPCPSMYRIRSEYSDVLRSVGFVLKCNRRAYNRIRPNFLAKIRLFRWLYQLNPVLLFKFLNLLSISIGLIEKVIFLRKGELFHEFQIYAKV